MARTRVLSPRVDPLDRNPYARLLTAALERRGYDMVGFESFDARRLHAQAAGADVVHLQWLEPFLASVGRSVPERAVRTHVRLARMVRTLEAERRAPRRLVWTVHNLEPHERAFPWADSLLTRATVRAASGLIVHSHYAAARVVERLRPGCPVWVAPHGHYLDAYPRSELGADEAREKLGLAPDGATFLCFGLIRPYKRLPEVIRAFREASVPDAQLVVAGRPLTDEIEAQLRTAAADDPQVHLHLRDVPDALVPDYHRAADAAVLNYREVYSSGALMLALSQGLPVIAPREGSALEFLTPQTGWLFDTERPLAATLAAFDGRSEAHRNAALGRAQEFSWERMAGRVAAAYEGVEPDRTA